MIKQETKITCDICSQTLLWHNYSVFTLQRHGDSDWVNTPLRYDICPICEDKIIQTIQSLTKLEQ